MDSAVLGDRVVVSCQWSVVSCQLSVVSCQWSVVSGQWSVVSGQLGGLALGGRFRAVILDAELRIRSGGPFEAACFGVFIGW